MSDRVKKKSDKKKEKDTKKENGKIKKIDDEYNIYGDLEIREIQGDKEREEMYEKKLEMIRNLYYRTK